MTNLIKSIPLFAGVLFLTACTNVVIKSDSDPNVDLAALKKFYVQKLPEDERGIEKIIAEKLNEFGFQATSGSAPKPTDPVDAIVTYKDRWMWDITMYMLEIQIELHNPDTNFVFASGKSYRTSLSRRDPDEMVDEVFRDLFAGKVDLPGKKDDKNDDEEE